MIFCCNSQCPFTCTLLLQDKPISNQKLKVCNSHTFVAWQRRCGSTQYPANSRCVSAGSVCAGLNETPSPSETDSDEIPELEELEGSLQGYFNDSGNAKSVLNALRKIEHVLLHDIYHRLDTHEELLREVRCFAVPGRSIYCS